MWQESYCNSALLILGKTQVTVRPHQHPVPSVLGRKRNQKCSPEPPRIAASVWRGGLLCLTLVLALRFSCLRAPQIYFVPLHKTASLYQDLSLNTLTLKLVPERNMR